MSGATYWPWWLGAASLAVVTVGCCIVARRPLGVSGILARFTSLREELEAERRRRAIASNEAALEAALLAATADAFGAAPAELGGCATAAPQGAAPDVPAIGAARKGCAECTAPGSLPSLGAHAVFLAAIVLGGLAVQLSRGGWTATFDMGPAFARLFGTGVSGALVLAAGGVLVGIGTSISGGCSTGHGLSGCSRLQPAGVAATASFIAAATAASFLLEETLP